MPTAVDITGRKFGKLIAIRIVGKRGKRSLWLLRCECGAERLNVANELLANRVTHCGCSPKPRPVRPRKPRGRRDFTYNTWAAMVQRCTNPNNARWKDYGGRGITICDSWRQSFKNFLSDMGKKPEGMSIDRIDNDRGYEPANCRWATRRQQIENRRCKVTITSNGETLDLKQWAERIRVPEGTIYTRMQRGWPVWRVLSPRLYRRTA